MSQRVDDVTGEPIRLSAREREQQRFETIAQINNIIKQLNTVTAIVQLLNERVDAVIAAEFAFQQQTFRQRMRWLIRGRDVSR